jgi:hypothetical protein
VQTFLPYPSFINSARCLDVRRLGKQRLECRQILSTLGRQVTHGTIRPREPTAGWENHPAVKMWRGYEDSLALYFTIVVQEWERRGYVNNMEVLNTDDCKAFLVPSPPPWFGDSAFHASHRSNLLRKDPQHYGRFGWKENPDLPYVWPVS